MGVCGAACGAVALITDNCFFRNLDRHPSRLSLKPFRFGLSPHTGLTGFPLLTIRTGVKIPPPTRTHLRVSLLLFWASVFMVVGDVRPWVVIEGVGYARPVVGLVMGT